MRRSGIVPVAASLAFLATAAGAQQGVEDPGTPQAAAPNQNDVQPGDERRTKEAREKLAAYLREAQRAASLAGDAEGAGRIRRWIAELRAADPPKGRPRLGMLLKQTGLDHDPSPWKYTERDPGASWTEPRFDDSRWRVGMAPFGSADVDFHYPKTIWKGERIWLRSTFTAPPLDPNDKVVLIVAYDDNPEIHINGRPLMKLPDWHQDYRYIRLTREQAALIRPGENTIAVTCANTAGAQVIDVGLLLDPAK